MGSELNTTSIWILALVGCIAVSGTIEPVTAREVTALQAGAAAADIAPREFPIRVRGRLRYRAHDALHSRGLVISDAAATMATME